MKKTLLILATAFAAFACQKGIQPEAVQPGQNAPEGYRDIVIEANSTKCAIADDGSSTWETGDELAVYDGSAIQKFTLTDGAGTSNAKFSGTVSDSATDLTAVYPFDAAKLDGSSFGIVVPEVQTIATRSYGVASAICTVASPSAVFEPASAVVRFTAPAGADEVIFHGGKGAGLASGSDQIEVILPNTDGGVYEASFIPGTYGMFNVFVKKSGKFYAKEGSNSLVLKAGEIKDVKSVDASEEAVLIYTKDELDAFAASPATSAYLCADIDFDGGAFTPIEEFSKTFNGQNYNLYKFNVRFSSSEAAGTYNKGLFGILSGATVKNLEIGNFTDKTGYSDASGVSVNSFTSDSIVNAGILAGTADGATVKNVKSYAWICVGGDCAVVVRCSNLIGLASGAASTISGCSADIENRFNGTFDNKSDAQAKTITIAGILAYDNAGCTITNCVNHAEMIINCRQCRYAAGIVARSEEGIVQTISKCENYGAINATAMYFQEKSFYGGISAYLADKSSVIDHCKNYGNINAKCAYKSGQNGTDVRFFVGGIVASCAGSVSYCDNTGDFTYNDHASPQKTGCPRIGGIAGSDATPVKIEHCTNSGDILNATSGKDYSSYGGIIGTLASNSAIISDCSVECTVKSTMTTSPSTYYKFYVGGLVGYLINKVSSTTPNFVGCTVKGTFTTNGGEYAGMVIGNCDAGQSGTYVIGSTDSPVRVSGSCGTNASPVASTADNLHCLSTGYSNPSYATINAVLL